MTRKNVGSEIYMNMGKIQENLCIIHEKKKKKNDTFTYADAMLLQTEILGLHLDLI